MKHFGPDIRAVDGIDLSIPEGQVFGFLGQNGSGKSTTVRMLTTLLQPTSGHGQVGGFDVLRQPGKVRQACGVALQEAGLDELQTGRELLALQGRLFGMGGDHLKARVNELLRIVDLEDAADRRLGGYSGGMQRRLDLAAALIHSPRILFLDEPTTGLDPISRESVWRYVQQLNKERGVTIFLTTQYLEEADRLADDVAIIDSGKIVAQGSPAELKASIGTDVLTIGVEGSAEATMSAAALFRQMEGVERVQEVDGALVVYVKDGARAVPRAVRLLDDAGITTGAITLAHPTLNDVFLRKTGHHLEAGATVPAAEVRT
ncbi:MAG: ATP-binding cassette domain-containing protein [Dehalococcoidia bacterium]|nr:ATP-binding cassette domain-containing protein [Dehalococcoidia bacterium]MCA9845602.1 ATP-binding cassette domain-containing protein [Dehalococcoidia bacterium]MCA9853471.1 ATP-binding cassette domain-containing protein [Dehalococcoidia bacterium]